MVMLPSPHGKRPSRRFFVLVSVVFGLSPLCSSSSSGIPAAVGAAAQRSATQDRRAKRVDVGKLRGDTERKARRILLRGTDHFHFSNLQHLGARQRSLKGSSKSKGRSSKMGKKNSQKGNSKNKSGSVKSKKKKKGHIFTNLKSKKKKSGKKQRSQSSQTKSEKRGSKRSSDGEPKRSDDATKVVDEAYISFLASNDLAGRENDSAGSLLSQEYLIDKLMLLAAVGLDSGNAAADEREAFKQTFDGGTNILGLIKGENPDEIIMLGAHYDHLSSCRDVPESINSNVCNGAADNAASVGIVLSIGRHIASQYSAAGTKPPRSIVLALWDREEDGLKGSEHYVNNPLVPLENMIAYLNWDIQGANLLPSLREITFALGSETGGPVLTEALQRSLPNVLEQGMLDVQRGSAALGSGRSDHKNFIEKGIPSIFFTDANNGCYHTTGDESDRLDYAKIERQGQIGLNVALDLLTMTSKPNFDALTPLLSYDDMILLSFVLGKPSEDELGLFVRDLGLFVNKTNAERWKEVEAAVNVFVDDGPGNFDPIAAAVALTVTNQHLRDFVAILTATECDNFLAVT